MIERHGSTWHGWTTCLVLVLLSFQGGCLCAETAISSTYLEHRALIGQVDPLLKGRLITKFAYLGSVLNDEWLVYEVHTVGKGMLAPRGYQALLVARRDGKDMVISVHIQIDVGALSPPLWTAGNRIYLHGRTTGMHIRTGGRHYNGNCIELFMNENGAVEFRMLDVQAYGSSGGIEDRVPSEQERESERRSWDADDGGRNKATQ